MQSAYQGLLVVLTVSDETGGPSSHGIPSKVCCQPQEAMALHMVPINLIIRNSLRQSTFLDKEEAC